MKEKTILAENGLLRRYTGPGGAVTLPAGLTAVGRTAFFRREDVTAVTLPEGLESIGGSAFAECTALERVTIPESLSELGSWAFCGCAALREIRLPAALRRIKERTFWRCSAMKTAELSEGLRSIDAGAFRGCVSLREIVLPRGLRRIGEGAFAGCVSLREIEIPETAESVAPTALEGCTALERITLRAVAADTRFVPAGVPVVAPGVSPAQAARPLELTLGYAMARREGTAYAPELETEYAEFLRSQGSALAPVSLTGHPGLLEALLDAEAVTVKDVDALLSVCDEVETRTALLGYRGRLTGATDAVPFLWEREDPDLSTEPLTEEKAKERWDFVRGEDGLTVTAWKGRERGACVPDRIGDVAVTAVGERAFSPLQAGLTAAERLAREEIAGIYLPYGIRRIGGEAFRDCAALKELLLPELPESVGHCAFLGTPWWEAQPDGCIYLGEILYRFKGQMAPDSAVTVREGTVSVARGAFRDCEELTSVSFPPGLKAIGPTAFYNAARLRSPVFPDTLEEIGEYAFHGCMALEEVILPEGFRTLGDRAFYGCRALRSVRAPGSLVSIGQDVFRRCGELVLIAPEGSEAERYARENGIPFRPEGEKTGKA